MSRKPIDLSQCVMTRFGLKVVTELSKGEEGSMSKKIVTLRCDVVKQLIIDVEAHGVTDEELWEMDPDDLRSIADDEVEISESSAEVDNVRDCP